ncbi:TPA: hypothetical protein ACQ8V2_003753 [Escherichia coli]|uniref:hypothetical protein n=2 Tax=Escherichia coli TaxID=562 RepID=UPI00050AD003|nr:hypothetical protein [Escherichia coli]EFA8284822.1 hypothetical protein [Escherichia coli O157]EER0851836.1 hypothetical protein [Escherichia coli]EEZ5826535.1 hypothetical protein [Escherichia coli]EFG0706593.1 hypothetical protein [Escherichia coli]EFG4662707.1 hypothetical protein [Escherichia coli]
MKTNENVLRSRAPRGVMSNKPVAMRLLPAEIAELEALALDQNRSMSSMARIIFLNGITLFRQSVNEKR